MCERNHLIHMMHTEEYCRKLAPEMLVRTVDSGKRLWEQRPSWFLRRKGIRRLIVDAARTKRQVFDGTPTISHELKGQLRGDLRRQVNRLLVLRVKSIRSAIIVNVVWFLLFWPRVHRVDPVGQSLAGYLLLLSTVMIVLLPAVIQSCARLTRLASVNLTAVWTGTLVAGCLLWRPQLQHWLNASTAMPAPAIEQSIGFGLGFSTLMLAMSLLSIRHMRLKMANPDAVVVDCLLDILSLLQAKPSRWSELSVKRDLIAELEAAASIVEGDLPALLQTGNAADDRWFGKMTSQSAAALRSLKRWVLMPKLDTRDRLTDQVCSILVSVLRGDWDNLPRKTQHD